MNRTRVPLDDIGKWSDMGRGLRHNGGTVIRAQAPTRTKVSGGEAERRRPFRIVLRQKEQKQEEHLYMI